MRRLILPLWFLFIGLIAQAQTQSLTGTVISVASGDTITVLDSHKGRHKIRLWAIEAPEKDHPFGNTSKENLSRLVLGKTVTVEYNYTDKYDRIIGKVLLDRKDMNLEQLRAGMAWLAGDTISELRLSETDYDNYFAAEKGSALLERGLWKDANPTSPWELRNSPKEKSDESPSNHSSSGKASQSEDIVGDKASLIYYLPSCPDYAKISPQNQVPFRSEEAAQKAGYRKARNCPKCNTRNPKN
jgi:endonuclease YncB( thermonuclease family)